ncbi:MAG: hypothetical protein LBQ08_02580 [Holosporaceae bacterium]|jgi:hypothetical protein|nr:hypothetical protein [Holosporaceae bacterium]
MKKDMKLACGIQKKLQTETKKRNDRVVENDGMVKSALFPAQSKQPWIASTSTDQQSRRDHWLQRSQGRISTLSPNYLKNQ